MKRPLLIVAIGYMIGIIWGLYCNRSIVPFYILIIAICLLLKLFFKSRKEFKLFSLKRYFRYIKIFLKFNVIIMIIISSLISNIITLEQNKKYDTLYPDATNDVYLTGIIVSNARQKEYKDIYKIKVESLGHDKKFEGTYLYLNLKSDIKEKIEYGDKVTVTGDFMLPQEQRNYKGFNYKEFLKSKKIYGTIKVSKISILKKAQVNPIFMISNKAFLKIKYNIEAVFPEGISQLALGIMLGYTDKLDEDIKQNFRDSNIAHILAVSGMHISFIILGLMFIFNKRIGKWKSRICIALVLILYMFITGFAPSVVRAGIMGIFVLGSGTLHRKNDIWNSIAISLLVIMIYNPFLITSLSVLLSYGGAVGIIVFNKTIINMLDKIRIKDRRYKYKISKKTLKITKYLKEVLSIVISAQIVIIPIMIMHFNTVGISFCITNVLISIIIGPIVMLGFLAILISFISIELLKVISYILSPLLQVLMLISELGNKLPLNKIYVATPNYVQLVFYYLMVFVINSIYNLYLNKSPTPFQYRARNLIGLFKYKCRINKNRIVSCILVSCTVFSIISVIPQSLKIHFIDVGQGDSTLIITPMKQTILIDGGGTLNNSFDIGKNTLLPYLLDRGVTKIDYILVSHFDQDHVRADCYILWEKLRSKMS